MNEKIRYILIFVLGFLSCAFILTFNSKVEMPLGVGTGKLEAPSNNVREEDIIVRDNEVVLNIGGVSISRYAPTGSMKPVFDKGANGIRVIPDSPSDINVGDIISFNSGQTLIVHRVVKIDRDDKGVYYVTKGDNNSYNDGKVRFEQIEYITIGVIW